MLWYWPWEDCIGPGSSIYVEKNDDVFLGWHVRFIGVCLRFFLLPVFVFCLNSTTIIDIWSCYYVIRMWAGKAWPKRLLVVFHRRALFRFARYGCSCASRCGLITRPMVDFLVSPHVPYPLVHNGRSCPSRYVGCCQDIRTLAATGRCSSFSLPSPAPRLIDYICRLYSAMCFRHAMLRNGIYDTARCSLHSAVSIMPHGLVYVQLQGQKCTAYGLT